MTGLYGKLRLPDNEENYEDHQSPIIEIVKI